MILTYKGKLRELCRREGWELPKYSSVNVAPNERLSFTATVDVNGQLFSTTALYRYTKKAKHYAAKVALDHFNSLLPSLSGEAATKSPVAAPTTVDPSTLTAVVANSNFDSSVAPAVVADLIAPPAPSPEHLTVAPPASAVADAPRPELLTISPVAPLPEFPAVDPVAPPPELPVIPVAPQPELPAIDPVLPLDLMHIYQRKLKQYISRENLADPVYTTENVGPPSARRYKSTVAVGGKSYQTMDCFSTVKEAEKNAAKVACEALSVKLNLEEAGLYKSMLHTFCIKRGLPVPSFDTTSSGSHNPVRISTVKIGERTFRGAEATNKKQAEMFAARLAFCTLVKEYPAKNNRGPRDEDDHLHAKRIKPSNVADAENPFTLPAVVEPIIRCKPSFQFTFKTVVYPRDSNLPIPEGATMMPFSDDEWVAYKIDKALTPEV